MSPQCAEELSTSRFFESSDFDFPATHIPGPFLLSKVRCSEASVPGSSLRFPLFHGVGSSPQAQKFFWGDTECYVLPDFPLARIPTPFPKLAYVIFW